MDLAAVLRLHAWRGAMLPLAVMATVGLAAPATAGETADVVLEPGQRTAQQVTIYQNGRGLVTEAYRFAHPAGTLVLELAEAPEALEPRSLQVAFADADLVLREQRPRPAPVTPHRLLEEAVGGPVTLVFATADGGERRVAGTLLAARGGMVVATADGILLEPDARVVLPAAAATAGPPPAWQWEVEAGGRGSAAMDISYLTGGLNWTADYVITQEEGAATADVTVWVTVQNDNEVGYRDSDLSLVAGEVRQLTGAPRARGQILQAEAMSSRAMDMEDAGFAREKVGEVHVYSLGRPVSLPAYASRQFVLLAARDVPVRQRLVAGAGGLFLQGHGPAGEARPVPVETRLEFTNGADDGLGQPLPAGIARLFSRPDGGGRVFLGEDRLAAAAVGEEISLTTGQSFDLVAERTQTDYQRRPGQRLRYEAAFRYDLRNRGDEEATLEIRDAIPGDWQLLDSSHPSTRPDAGTLAFRVVIPADGELAVSYRVRVD